MRKVCCQNSCPTSVFVSRKTCPHLLQESCYCIFSICLCFVFLSYNSSALKSIEFSISVQRERRYFSYYKKKKRNSLSKNTVFDFKPQNNMSVIKIRVEIRLYLSIALCRYV